MGLKIFSVLLKKIQLLRVRSGRSSFRSPFSKPNPRPVDGDFEHGNVNGKQQYEPEILQILPII